MRNHPLLPLLCALLPAVSCHNGGGGPTSPATLTKISLLTRQEIPVGAFGLRSVFAADLTGDRAPEVLVSSLVDRKLVYMVASSPGVLSTKAGFVKTYSETPGRITGGDVDGDHDLDAACLFERAGLVRIYRNNGLGGLSEDAKAVKVGGAASDLLLADVDRDGRADLIVSARANLRIFLSLANGSFSALPPLAAAKDSDLGALAAGDLDGDGWTDLVACDPPKNVIHVWKGSKAGFTPAGHSIMSSVEKGPLSVQAADLDGDADLDLVVAAYGAGKLVWFPGDGRGAFAAGRVLALDGDPFHVAAGDLTGDGIVDLVVSYLDRAAVGMLRGIGGGRFAPERQYGTTGLPTEARIVDFDLDGGRDLLTSGLDARHISWLRGVPSGLAGSENFATGHRAPSFVVVTDLNGDGLADGAVSDRVAGALTILAGGRDGRLSKAVDLQVGSRAGSLSHADFDKDGREDLVVAVAGGLRFLLNRGSNGGFRFDLFPPLSQKPFSAGIGPFEVASVEADGDGAADLLVADYGGNEVFVLKGAAAGFGFSSPYPPLRVAGGPLSLVTGDFNHDAAVDFAVSRFKAATVTVFIGDGQGGFTKAADLAAGDRPNYLRSADFDGNGFVDLVVSNLGGTALTLWLGAQTGFQARTLRVGDGPTALLARDLNRDGLADILVANADSADFHVLLGDGRGGFPNIVRIPGSMKSLSADMGDVDGDGLADVLVASLFTNRVSLFLNRSR